MKHLSLKAMCLIFLFWTFAAVAGFYPINRGMVNQQTTITSSGGTTSLVASSNQVQVVGGTSTHSVQFPNAELLPLDWWYRVWNNSTQNITVKNFSGTTLATILPGNTGLFHMTDRLSTAGSWYYSSFVSEAYISPTVSTVAAAASINTPNTLVLRDGSGNFAAGTITAALTGNASTATALASDPVACTVGQFVNDVAADGTLSCATPAGAGDVVGPASSTDNAIALWDGTAGDTIKDSSVTVSGTTITANLSGNVTGNVTGNSDTATALAANPADCGVGEFANAIAANGDLTCATPASGGDVSGPVSSTDNAIAVWNGTGGDTLKDSSVTISGSTITGSLSGNATTSTSLAANPSDCASDRYATTIAANGDLTCVQVSASAGITGTLPVANGGTGQTSYTDGQLLIGNSSGNTLSKATLTAGSGMSITNGGGSITIAEADPTTSAISSTDIDWSTLKNKDGVYTKTLSADTTFTFSNATAGQTIIIRLTNTASNYTVTWPAMKWSGGVSPTMTVGAKSDIYTIIYDGTNYFGSYVQDF